MSALAVFTSRPNSHPFQERQVSLHEAVKIGRSVARARPAANNAVFDCKVLSRNHALIWYEDGKFFLQDTKSANGTFVNNQRLSKGSEESPPREIFSGDTIQFGVDVMENSRRVTHSCIIVTIQLFHADGSEAVDDHSSGAGNALGSGAAVQSQELYQLAQYLQEALHREQILESKLSTLQHLLDNTQDASKSGWQALIDEDRLLSRLELLENQLAAYSKSQSEDTLRHELVALQEDKFNYETTAKESLRKVLQEKLEAVQKLSDLERSLSSTEEECVHLREMCENSQKDLTDLAEKHQQQLQHANSLQDKIQEAEKQQKDESEQWEKERTELETRLSDLTEKEDTLAAKVESIQAENDFTKEQMANMKAKYETYKENNGETPFIPEVNTQGIQVDLVSLMDLQALHAADSSEDEGSDVDMDIDHIVDEIERVAEMELMDTSKRQEDLQANNTTLLHTLLPDNEQRIPHSELEAHLHEVKEKLKEAEAKIEKYKEELDQVKAESACHVLTITSLQEQLKMADVHMNEMVENAVSDLTAQLKESRKQAENSSELTLQLKEQIACCEAELDSFRNQPPAEPAVEKADVQQTSSTPDSNPLQQQIQQLNELLHDARDAQKTSEAEMNRCKGEMENLQCGAQRSEVERQSLQGQVTDLEQVAADRAMRLAALQAKLEKAESSSKDVRQQILSLRDQLEISERRVTLSQGEAEQLRERLKSKQEELEYEKIVKTSQSLSSSPPSDLHVQEAKNRAEFTALKEECAHLRQRIQDIETDMTRSRREKLELQGEFVSLQDSYHELQRVKDELETSQVEWRMNLTDAQKNSDNTKRELLESSEEIAQLKDQCNALQEELTRQSEESSSSLGDYQELADQTRTVSMISMVPLIVLLLGIFLAFHPFLQTITATW